MTDNTEANTSSISTKWEWRKVKMSSHPQGTSTAAPQAPRPSRKRRRDWWGRAQIVVAYRGGAECSYLITWQGRSWRYPGHMDLHDVMTDLARRWG